MFAADAATFLADFGDPVTWAPTTGPFAGTTVGALMIFDQPAVDIQGGDVTSRQYEVTFETAAWPGLKRGDVLTVFGSGGGAAYVLRTNPHPKDDGVFSTAPLTKA